MSRPRFAVPRWLLVLALVLGLVGFASRVRSAGPDLVVAQVYAGGQSGGAPLARDYVVLFNRGDAAAALDGWSLQYAAAGGSTWRATVLAGTVPPGGSYLVGVATGEAGAQVPVPDARARSPWPPAALAWLEPAAGPRLRRRPRAVRPPPASSTSSATARRRALRGRRPRPLPRPRRALLRTGDGCSDTGDNAADFALGTPVPRSTPAPPSPCGAAPPATPDPRSGPRTSGTSRAPATARPGMASASPACRRGDRPAGQRYWLQDPVPDADAATAEGILVFLDAQPAVAVGQAVAVDGMVAEFRPGTATPTSASPRIQQAMAVVATNQELPDPIVLGPAGRALPATGSKTTPAATPGAGAFEPAADGLDFWESLEGMRVRVDDAEVVVGPRMGQGEVPVLASSGMGATGHTPRGGIVVSGPGSAPDLNPERIFLGNRLLPSGNRTPPVDVGDSFPGPVIGVVDYAFGNYVVLPSTLPEKVPAATAPIGLAGGSGRTGGGDPQRREPRSHGLGRQVRRRGGHHRGATIGVGIALVDVRKERDSPFRVDLGGPVQQHDRHRLVEKHGLGAAARDHGIEPRRAPARAEQLLGELERVLDANAARAERAAVAIEQIAARRVVQIDRVLVREHELDAAERIVGPRAAARGGTEGCGRTSPPWRDRRARRGIEERRCCATRDRRDCGAPPAGCRCGRSSAARSRSGLTTR